MEFRFAPMTLSYAEEIETWSYDGHVRSILVEPYRTSYSHKGKMKGPGGCEGFVALDHKDRLAGLLEVSIADQGMEIGLALHPEKVGKGLGKSFVDQGIRFAVRHFGYTGDEVRLMVNVRNKPALRVYEKAGFTEYRRTDDEIEMRRHAHRGWGLGST